MHPWKPSAPVTPALLAALTPLECPSELEGLSPELLLDLRDLVQKFGCKDPEEAVTRLSHTEPIDMGVTASVNSDNYTLIIFGPGSIMGLGGPSCHILPLPDTHMVVWDKRVSIEHVQQFILAIDTHMCHHGGILSNGQRKDLNLYAHGPTLKVDDVFQDEGNFMPVLPPPGEPATEEVLRGEAERLCRQFDKPHELRFIVRSSGQCGLIHQRDEEYHFQRDQALQRVFARHGIDMATLKKPDGSDIGPEDFTTLRAEIDQEMNSSCTLPPQSNLQH